MFCCWSFGGRYIISFFCFGKVRSVFIFRLYKHGDKTREMVRFMTILLGVTMVGVSAIPNNHTCDVNVADTSESADCGYSGIEEYECEVTNDCCWNTNSTGVHCYNSSLTPAPTAFPTPQPTEFQTPCMEEWTTFLQSCHRNVNGTFTSTGCTTLFQDLIEVCGTNTCGIKKY